MRRKNRIPGGNRRSRVFRLGCAALGCLLVLTGCSGDATRETAPVQTLPPARSVWQAPEGDVPIGTERLYALYLPGNNGLRLTAQHVSIGPGSKHDTAESLVRALLSFETNEQAQALGAGTRLSLFGDHPVELSGGVCTVNLGSSALQLSYRSFYTVALSLAATLCELDGVESVNVLVADQSVGLDVAGGLAMGSITGRPGENLPVLWEQMEAKRTPLGGDMRQTPLNSAVTLYFPLAEGNGVLCETRNISFEGQTPQQLASGILREMSNGSLRLTQVPVMPDLSRIAVT